ncbi:MAG: MarR family transcriptional regulator [Pseudomonadota bacterium]
MTDPTELAYFVDRFMRRIHSGLHQRAVAVDTERVGQFGGLILMALAEMEPVSMQALVTHMARDKSQITRVINSLESKGYVASTGHPEDKRVRLLRLTEKGHDLVREFTHILGDVIGGLTKSLSASEKQHLLALLRKI